MPPQQFDRLLDLFDHRLGFSAHEILSPNVQAHICLVAAPDRFLSLAQPMQDLARSLQEQVPPGNATDSQ